MDTLPTVRAYLFHVLFISEPLKFSFSFGHLANSCEGVYCEWYFPRKNTTSARVCWGWARKFSSKMVIKRISNSLYRKDAWINVNTEWNGIFSPLNANICGRCENVRIACTSSAPNSSPQHSHTHTHRYKYNDGERVDWEERTGAARTQDWSPTNQQNKVEEKDKSEDREHDSRIQRRTEISGSGLRQLAALQSPRQAARQQRSTLLWQKSEDLESVGDYY